VNVIGLLIAEL